MNTDTAQKLEVINQFKKKYPGWVNPELLSIKYCQNNKDAFLEMIFNNAPDQPVIINLDFISDDFGPLTETGDIPSLFKPDTDVVDNALTFVELGTYSLMNCVDGLFSGKAEKIINDDFKRTVNK